MKSLLTPKQVARAIGVSESSLKRWCDKGLLTTQKTVGGHRRLPFNDVIQFLRQSGQRLSQPELLGLPATAGQGSTVISRACEQVVAALVVGDAEQVRRLIVDLYLAGQRAVEICDKVLAEALHRIGQQWGHGEVEVYQERRAVEIVVRVLYELREMLPSLSPSAPAAFGGTLSGDFYILPTTMAELALREAGWRADSFGTNLPPETFAAALASNCAPLAWLSVSHIPDRTTFLSDYERVARAASLAGTALVVGGRALDAELRQDMQFAAACDNFRHLVGFAANLPAARAAGASVKSGQTAAVESESRPPNPTAVESVDN
ncbi:MAG: B12-binding domain-containing protein [Planctomycetaceae bacterium]|nr:B12-binding domain-containing protein [Planctomycetaceae bacterium]